MYLEENKVSLILEIFKWENGYKNGVKINKLNRNTSGEYVFTDFGLYTIEIEASITIDGREQFIFKTDIKNGTELILF